VKLLIGLALGTLFALSQGTVSAAGPYTSGTTGYDVSYPNCSLGGETGSFAVVGVTGGRPFSANSCASSEYSSASATGNVALYFNTGYSGAYKHSVYTDCTTLSQSYAGDSAHRTAFAIGCSEAEYAQRHAPGTPTVWWLDVETGNSWSSTKTLNQATIQGAVTRLEGVATYGVGVYSTAASWSTIAGTGWNPSGLAADWLATGATSSTGASSSCSQSFSGAHVWLVQYSARTTTGSAYDGDLAC
jgi:hypothetical protein